VLAVIKMRRSNHSSALCPYDVTPTGLEVHKAMRGYHGIINRRADAGRARRGGCRQRRSLTGHGICRRLDRLRAAR